MSDTQIQAGMDWVETRLGGLADRQEVTITTRGWETDDINCTPGRCHLVMLLNGQREVVTFDDADLEEVLSNRRLQIIVEGGLLAFLNDQLRGSDVVRWTGTQDS